MMCVVFLLLFPQPTIPRCQSKRTFHHFHRGPLIHPSVRVLAIQARPSLHLVGHFERILPWQRALWGWFVLLPRL